MSHAATNDVAGTLDSSSTGWWSRYEWWTSSGSGSGSGGSTSTGDRWSSSGHYSYAETVSYPGFYGGVSYSGGALDYIGDAFHSGSGWGWSWGGWTGPWNWSSSGTALESTLAADNQTALVAEADDETTMTAAESSSAAAGSDGGRETFLYAPLRQTEDAVSQTTAPEAAGTTVVVEVDAAGNLRSITDPLGNRTTYTYDAAGNPTSVTDPNGDTTTFAYDSKGNLVRLVDPLGNETIYVYDERGQCIREEIVVDGVVLTRQYAYDDSGRLVRRVDRNGRVRAFVYDDENHVYQEIWYNTVAEAEADQNRQNTITWTYDAAGNLRSVVDDFSSYYYVYDPSGRVTSETVCSAGGPVSVLSIDYGTRTDNLPVTVAAAVDGRADFVNRHEDDSEGRLIDLRQTGQGGSAVADKHVTFAYQEDGQLVKITRYESLDSSRLVAVSEYG